MGRRLAALDVGDKRIGVAISDGLGLTAQPLGTVERRSLAGDAAAIARMLDSYEIEKVVVGLPFSLSGREGDQADKVRHFAARFERETGWSVVFQDERLSSAESERMLVASGLRRERRRQVRDRVAAALILQAYLDSTPRPPSAG